MDIPKTTIRRALLAASKDQTRPDLSQLLIDGGVCVGTDGHRLHVIEDEACTGEAQIPRWALEAALEVDQASRLKVERLKVERSGDEVSVYVADAVIKTMRAPLFAPWRQVLDATRTPRVAEWGVRDLRKVIKGLTPTDVGAIHIDPNVAPWVKAAYVADALKAVGDAATVTLGWDGPLDPLVIRAPGATCVISPMRVR